MRILIDILIADLPDLRKPTSQFIWPNLPSAVMFSSLNAHGVDPNFNFTIYSNHNELWPPIFLPIILRDQNKFARELNDCLWLASMRHDQQAAEWGRL